jgi:hypothetical protein
MAFGNDPTTGTFSPTQGNVDAILKDIYSDEGVTDEFFTENPYLALMSKKEDVTGRFYDQAVWASAGQAQSRSSNFATTQTNAGLSGEAPYVFLVPKLENIAVANISSKAIAETSSTKGAFIDMVRATADNQLQQLINDTSFGLFRNSVPYRGIVGGSVAGTTLTLTNQADIVNFELGMFLDFASTGAVGGTIRQMATATSCQISAIDYSSSSMTVKWNGGGTATLTAQGVSVGDFVARAGDFGTYAVNSGTGTTTAVGFNGFLDWIVYGGPASNDSFLGGVNRSANATRLAGNWMDGTGGNLEEVLEKGANRVATIGGKLSHYIMPYSQYTALANAQGAKVQLINQKATSVIGFDGLQIVGANGRITCLPDRYCPSNTIAGVKLESWKLISVGKAVHTFQDDGKVWLRSYNQNGMEIRFYSLANLVCKEPRANINIRVNSLAI